MMRSGSSNQLRRRVIRRQSQQSTKNEWANMAQGFSLFLGRRWSALENNNAEHAIHAFARVRRFANGRFTEDSVREYFVMLSVAEMCEYQNIDVLEVLLAQANKSSDCRLGMIKSLCLMVTEPWSNGPVEGHINRLKTLKHQMYGRAGVELLRARLLPESRITGQCVHQS